MPLFKHRFQGALAAGDEFSYQWYSNEIRDIATAHGAALVWNQTLWNGSVAGNGFKDHCTVGVFMTSVITSEITPATGRQTLRRETAQVIAGVAAGNALPADCSLVVSLRTDLATRSGRGRFYLPQPAASNLTVDGGVAADLINDLMASLTAAWAAYNTGVDRPVIYSPTFRVSRNITSFNIGDRWDTQRRRENKVKEIRTTTAMP
jgi:hypothetical protein